MQNRIHALRAQVDGIEIIMPTSYDDEDNLLCETPRGFVRAEENEDAIVQFERLLENIKAAHLEPYGCFSCRFFHRTGAFDISSSLGYCLEGKIGKHVKPTEDFTLLSDSCDAFNYGTLEDQKTVAREWASSLPPFEP